MVVEKKIPFSERRILPRCAIDTDVKILINSKGEELQFNARSINISLRAFELACDDSLIQAILAQNTYPHECDVEFAISGESKNFRILTQVITHRRLSQDQYQLVLRFVGMDHQVQEKLLDELATLRVLNTKQESVSLAV